MRKEHLQLQLYSLPGKPRGVDTNILEDERWDPEPGKQTQSSTSCQQIFLSQPLSQPQFFMVKLCPNWTKPLLVSPHHQQTQPHGNHQSLPSTDLTSTQKQANIARESNVYMCFTLGALWSVANKFNGQFHFCRWDALLKQLCGQIGFCSQYSAVADTILMVLKCLLCHLPLLKGVRHTLCFRVFRLPGSSFSGLLF